MSEMPDSKKTGSTIPGLAELLRSRAKPKPSMAMRDKLAEALQEQFDEAIYQRDGVLEKYSAAEAKIAELTQELAKMKLYCEAYNAKLLEQAMKIVESILASRQYFDPENYEAPPPPIKRAE